MAGGIYDCSLTQNCILSPLSLPRVAESESLKYKRLKLLPSSGTAVIIPMHNVTAAVKSESVSKRQ